MASFTLASQVFQSGTVDVYPASNWPAHQIPPSGDPVGSSATSASVSGGSVTFTGLTADTHYYAHQDQSGTDRYVAFSTYEGVPAAQQTGLTSLVGTFAAAGDFLTIPYVTQNSHGATTAVAWYAPIPVYEETTIDRIAIRLTAAAGTAGTARLGLYDSASGRPGSLLVDAGTVSLLDASTDSGMKLATVALTLDPGIYWAVCQTEFTGTAPEILGYEGVVPFAPRPTVFGNNVRGFKRTSSTGALAATAGAMTADYSATYPIIGLRVA